MCRSRIKDRRKFPCKDCHGKGWILVYPHGEIVGERRKCPKCNGTGTLNKED